jgi:KGK domain
MEEKSESNRTWQLIEDDDDILLMVKDTFTLGRFKELLIEDFHKKISTSLAIYDPNISLGNTGFNTNVPHFLRNLQAGHKTIDRTELRWQSILDCKFLKIGSKGWEKGKLRIQVIHTSQFRTKIS